MELIKLKAMPGFQQWGVIMADKPYVIVYDFVNNEYTASTKLAGDKTHYILDYGEGTKTIEEAKEAVLAYHRKQLS